MRQTPPEQQQQAQPPGRTAPMHPQPSHGEESYRGSGRLAGKRAIVTGGDSGIGRAVAIAFAREGADVAIAYLSEHDDARDTLGWIEEAGRHGIAMPGDLRDPAHCRDVVDRTVDELGGIDVLVSNAAHQMTFDAVGEISVEEWDYTLQANLSAMFYLVKAALPHMHEGASIIGTTSINADVPSPSLLAYDVTKAGIANLCAGLAQMLAPRGIRANSVAPGPIWTPLIPSTMPPESVDGFGQQVPMGRPGQPAELAPVYVLLASDEASYVSGARVAVTGGQPIL